METMEQRNNSKNFGIIMYQGNDIVQSFNSKMNSMFGYDEASRKFV